MVLPSTERKIGGILLGVISNSMDVLAVSDEDFHIKFHVRNKAGNFVWSLVAVYGAAQEEYKADFLRELVNLAKDKPHRILIGGDFNMLRFRHEKSRCRFDNHWPFFFNAVIDSLDLREVHMTRRLFAQVNCLLVMCTSRRSKLSMTALKKKGQ